MVSKYVRSAHGDSSHKGRDGVNTDMLIVQKAGIRALSECKHIGP